MVADGGGLPSVALFCATFLKPEMLHIHRHVAGLSAYRPVVLAQKVEGRWPVDHLEVIPRSPFRFLARAGEKSTSRPWQITPGETRRMLAVLERHQCALLHVFFGNVAVHLLPLLRQSPVPVVVSFHGSDVAGGMATPGYGSAVEEMFRLAAAVPCRSHRLLENVAALGCPPEKLRLMRTILPDIPFRPPVSPRDGAWRIVQASRLVPKKGLVTALHAFAAFHRDYPLATFTIAGEGPQLDDLRTLAADLGLSSRVEFTGFLPQEELQRLFADSHIFLHPSETVNGDVEGVPNAMLEAMAVGLPVVATRHGGIPEVITDGREGLLCEERDPVQVADALRRLASSPDLYAALASEASASVREQFSAPRQVAAVEAIYREAVLASTLP